MLRRVRTVGGFRAALGAGMFLVPQAEVPTAAAPRSLTRLLDRISEASASSIILEAVPPPPVRVDLDALEPETRSEDGTQRTFRLDVAIARGPDGRPLPPKITTGTAAGAAVADGSGIVATVIPARLEGLFKDHPAFAELGEAGDAHGNRFVVFEQPGQVSFDLQLPSFPTRLVLSTRILGNKADAEAAGSEPPLLEILVDGNSLGGFALMSELVDRSVDLPIGATRVRLTLDVSSVQPKKGAIAALRSFAVVARDGRDRLRIEAPAGTRGLAAEYAAAAPPAVQWMGAADSKQSQKEWSREIALLPGRVGVVAGDPQPFDVLIGGNVVAGSRDRVQELVFDCAEFGTRAVTLRAAKGLRGEFWVVQPRALYAALNDPMASLRAPTPFVRGLETPPGHPLVRHFELFGETRRSLLAPVGSEISFPVTVSPSDRLECAVGAAWLTEESLPRGSLHYEVELVLPDGRRHSLVKNTLMRRRRTHWEHQSPVALTGFAGEARLVFKTSASGKSPFAASDALVAFAEPTLVHARGERRPNLLVYLIDTLRTDHCSAFGYPRETTPRLAELAAEGIAFERAYTQAPWTRPSVATLFTGWLHSYHGASKTTGLAPQLVTLGERMRDAGYATAAFIANAHVHGASLDFEQGFSLFEAIEKTKKRGDSRADEVHASATRWLDDHAGQPFFLYLHTIDPHAPYDPPEATKGTWSGGYSGAIGPRSTSSRNLTNLSPLAPADLQQVIDLYDEEILSNDREFAELCDGLRQRGLWDDTIVVVLSDHGEEFYEHEGWGHGSVLWEELLRVPLVIKPDKRESDPPAMRGLRVDGRVRVMDLMPTLLERLGLGSPAGESMGTSLAAVFTGGEVPDLPVIAEEYPDRRTLIAGNLKWIHFGPGKGKERTWLFDLAKDPRELDDFSERFPEIVKRMTQQIALLDREYAERGFGHVESIEQHLGALDEEALKQLGYIDTGEDDGAVPVIEDEDDGR